MSSHTPGPWKYEESERLLYGIHHWVIRKDCGNVRSDADWAYIAETSGNEATARLIAAAPELLEALVAASTWFSKLKQGPHDGANLENMKAHARAAIAKARGE